MNKRVKNSVFIILCLSCFSSCNVDKSQPNIELIQDMMDSPAILPQEYDAQSPLHSGMRVPPEGTQPLGFVPYRYSTDLVGAKGNKNPLEGKLDEETLKVGIKYFTIHCAICHGSNGEGGEKSSISERMALKPPTLTSDKIKGWTDGQIYHVITMGQGMMGPYASHIPEKYRWQVVNYIRYLQQVEQK